MKRIIREFWKRNICFAVVTIGLVAICVLCFGSVAAGQSTEKLKVKEQYYVELENQYIKEVREMLRDKGYQNSGVMLTRTVMEDGSREYHLNIHHKRLAGLSEKESKKLKECIKGKAFWQDGLSFVVTFSQTDADS